MFINQLISIKTSNLQILYYSSPQDSKIQSSNLYFTGNLLRINKKEVHLNNRQRCETQRAHTQRKNFKQ